MTLDLATGCIIEDLKVSNATSDKFLHCVISKQTKGMCTVFCHTDNKVESMEVPSTEHQRVPGTPSPKADNGAPNYISNKTGNFKMYMYKAL